MNEYNYETVKYNVENSIARVTLNRPEVHNAFNDTMIKELHQVFNDIEEQKEIRVVVLTGAGKSFCAGADLNWMRQVREFSYEENYNGSLKLAEMFHRMYACPKPTIARVNGATIGGGTGLVAVCDIVIASTRAKFSFSEVKLGLIPACISPYVLKRCGEGRCREFFITGERLSAEKAYTAGLVNMIAQPEDLDYIVEKFVARLVSSGPEAISNCKELLRTVAGISLDDAKKYTAEVIAKLRISDEGQEGMNAFLEKRKPRWVSDSD